MQKWVARQKRRFDNDSQNKKYANHNWIVHKSIIKSHLDEFNRIAHGLGFNLIVDDYSIEKSGLGYDGLSIQFQTSFTGNMIELKEENSRVFNYHKQKGAILHVTFSGTGTVQVFLEPSTSEDSMAIHNALLLYYTPNAKSITPEMIDRWLKFLFAYQRVTGVLHTPSLMDKVTVFWCKGKSFFMMYDTPKTKFKRYAGIYIPGVTLLVSLLVLILTIYTLTLQPQC
ncbi:hypothetical protein ACF2G4_20255 (plasmid) [Pantoea sp. C3]|uniref:hypothetical protein n=1 Tax=Pantoea phytostimulans TaxID=2769024 RepID=UPI0038F5EBBB